MKNVFIIFLAGLLFGNVMAGNITLDIEFENYEIETRGQYSLIRIEDSSQMGMTGSPSLPYRGLKVLLPEGEVISDLELQLSDPVDLEIENYILPVQPVYRFSAEVQPDPVEPDQDVYGQDGFYPLDQFQNVQTHFLSGFGLGFLAITPVQYNPVTNQVILWREITINISSSPDARAWNAAKYLHNDPRIVNFVSSNVVNPGMIARYSLPQLRDEPIDYLILTGEDYMGEWQDLALLYNQRGYTTEIYPVEDIEENFTGIDLQEKIRNFLIYKYENNSIRFVLLAGDIEIIPHRGFYGIVNENSPDPTIDYGIPADMYYSCLDRGPGIGAGPDWNNNDNDMWGEQNEADLVPEFAVGRLSFNNMVEIGNFIQKVERYLNSPVSEELDKALFLGEDLGWNVWGGDYMDEMIGGSSTHGHTTVGVPLDWEIDTLYDRNSYWTPYDLYSQFNAGPNLVNHLGHSSSTYTMKLSNPDVNTSNITNDGIDHNLFIVFTQGCYGGAFDYSDCITEKFTSIPTGTVSMISHSRYGWGSVNSTDGASQFYNREFIDAFFGEGIFNLGLALNDAKIDAIPFMSNVMYWVCYETNLQGDPALMVWTDNPQELLVDYPQEIVTGSTSVQVSCSEYNADVVIMMNDQLLGTGNTGISGETTINFSDPVEELVQLEIYVLKHNFLTYTGNIEVIPGEGPYVVCNTADYSETGDYIDGSIQSLDLVDIHITLDNIGLDPTQENVTAVLSTESDYVAVLQDYTEADPLPALESQTIENAFQVELLAGIPDETTISFTIDISADGNDWESTIFMNVQGPEIVFSDFTLDVISGDDENLDPGESAEIYLLYLNTGSGYSYNFATTLFSYEPYVSISGYDIIPQISPGELALTTMPFTIEITEDCPLEYYLQIDILGLDDVGTSLVDNFLVPVGVSGFTFENGDNNWEHYSLSGGYGDEWHLSNARNHTDNGEFSMKCGGSGTGDYSNFLHSALESPDIYISQGSFISFYHWMNAEIDNATTAWDGGLIEISVNGGAWEQFTPEGGYPYTIVPNPDSPFPGGTPVFSGNVNWEEVMLDVSAYSGSIRLRFVFGTDGAVTEEGWYIDDIRVIDLTPNDNDMIVPAAFDLAQNYPNPFNPVTTISFMLPESAPVRIDIYNLKGQLVNELVDKEYPAGQHQVVWEGTDSRNKPVGSGIYFYRMSSVNFSASRKMILMK